MQTVSDKQLRILAYSYTRYKALICDGAVRSGKTSIMTVAFVDWAMREFNRCQFAICGKTVASAVRNIVHPYMGLSYANERYKITFSLAQHRMTVSCGRRQNTFYVFGGKDESSYTLIQGLTLAGVFLDEVALMPQSFVNQALARCISIKDARYWFNCNPESPGHWFYKEWIQQPDKHNALHLHFMMEDNPILDAATLEEARRTWSGVFYRRYVLGEWVRAEGLVYPMFDASRHVVTSVPPIVEINYGIDVGHSNATVFLAVGLATDNRAYVVAEYYHSGKTGATKSPYTYGQDFIAFQQRVKDLHPAARAGRVYVDPSALGFAQQLREMGVTGIQQAVNDVIPGICTVASLIDRDLLRIHQNCHNMIHEIEGYSWDEKAAEHGADRPVKENDHAMDAVRYVLHTDVRKWARRKAVNA